MAKIFEHPDSQKAMSRFFFFLSAVRMGKWHFCIPNQLTELYKSDGLKAALPLT